MTHVDRVLYPIDGVLKADVIGYFVHIAPRMLPHIYERPVTRIRWPNGVAAEPFFEKNLPSHAPKWLRRITIEHSDGPITYPFVDSAAGLAWLAQHSALELHVPQWRLVDDERVIDRLVLDLDPGPKVSLDQCVEVAVWLRDRLGDSGLATVPVTSGSKGVHLYAKWPPDSPTSSIEFAKLAATAAAAAMPNMVTAVMNKRERTGKVFIDWSQNNPAKTTIAPYSLRGRDHPWVAAPRTWADLEKGGVTQLSWQDVLANDAPLDTDPMTAVLD